MDKRFLICSVALLLTFFPQAAFSSDGFLVSTALFFGKIIGFALVYFLGALFAIGLSWMALCLLAKLILLISGRVCAWRVPLIVKAPALIALSPFLLVSYLLGLIEERGLSSVKPIIDTSKVDHAKQRKKTGPIFGSHFAEIVLLDEHYHAGGRAVVRKLLNWSRPN